MKIEEMEHYNFLIKLFDFSQDKVKDAAFLGGLFGYILSVIAMFCSNVLGISVGLFALLVVVMVTDYITGLMAAKKEKQKIVSKKGLGWVFKLGSYMVFLSVSFILQNEIVNKAGFEFLSFPLELIHFYILIHIFMWETKSVDENFERLGYSFRILKLFSALLNSTKKQVKSKIDGQ
jgi:phage-related holin